MAFVKSLSRLGAVVGPMVLLLVFAVHTAGAQSGGGASLDVFVGSQREFVYGQPISRVSVGDPNVAQVTVIEENRFLLLGKNPGRTDVIVWLKGRPQAEYRSVSVRQNLVPLVEKLRADLAFRNVVATPTDKGLLLEGAVQTLDDEQRLLAIAHSYVASEVTSNVRIMQQQMVSVEVRVASISTTVLKRIGFDFSYLGNAFQLAVTGPNAQQGYNFGKAGVDLGERAPRVGDAFNLFLSLPNANFISVLGALSANNMAQILAEPTLAVRSGDSADFLVGGEIPIPVPQGNDGGIGIEYKTFGVQLKLDARVLTPDRIQLKVSPEVSDLDFTRAVTLGGIQIPAITRRSASTTVELGNGQSFVLAGLISSNTTNSDDALPLLGDLPILGQFFSRQEQTRERQELVIVVTPKLVSPTETPVKLPGVEALEYQPTLGDMLMRRSRPEDFMVRHGIMP